MLPDLTRLAAAVIWAAGAAIAAFLGGATAIVACSWDFHDLWAGVIVALALLPSIGLWFLLDWRQATSRAKWLAFVAPLAAAGCFLATLADVWPPSFDGTAVTRYGITLIGAIVATCLAIRAKRQVQGLQTCRFQFGLASLFLLTTLTAIFCACLSTFGSTVGLGACGWAMVVVLSMIMIQGAGQSPRGGWLAACLLAILAVYGPHAIVAVHTWLFNSCDHCRGIWLKFLWVMPGGIIEVIVLRVPHGVPPAVALVIAGALSLAVVATTAWLTKRNSRARWVALAIVGCLAAWSAYAADAIMRA
jgi:hypothetical protein